MRCSVSRRLVTRIVHLMFIHSYNDVLSAITKSGLPDDEQRAWKIIKRMKENGISPDKFTRKALEKFTKGRWRSRGDR
jgi:pentatricopeptide repeat protein